MATTENYRVYADLVMNTHGAADGLKPVRNETWKLTDDLTKAGIAGGLAGAAATMAFSAASRVIGGAFRAITGFIGGAVELNAEMDRMRISLGAVLSAAMGTTFEQGMKSGTRIFQQLKEDSITSVATGSQLLQIYQGIAGPLSKAGASMEQIRTMTRDSVAASTVLGVDFQQAQRDMMLMASGAGGLDVKMFRMLRATGAIAETTEQWNNMIPTERVEKLGKALAKFRGAAEAFGKSWEGVTSTMRGLKEEMTLALTEGAFKALAKDLKFVNDQLIANKKAIFGYLEGLGTRLTGVAKALTAFGIGATMGAAPGSPGSEAVAITIRPLLQLLTESFGALGDALTLAWTAMEPFVLLLTAVWGAVTLLSFPFRAFLAALQAGFGIIQALVEVIVGPLNGGLLGVISNINDVARAFDLWMKDLYDGVYLLINETREMLGLKRLKFTPYQMGEYGPKQPKDDQEKEKNLFDFRGSKITIKQEFRNADPDKIALQVTRDISKQAVMRLRSGLAPGFTG